MSRRLVPRSIEGGGGPLGGLTDVVLTEPVANGDVLTFDFSTQTWINLPPSAGPGGTVSGPAVTTVTAIARWANVTGTLLSNSGVLIDASNNMTGVTTLAITANTSQITLGTGNTTTLTMAALTAPRTVTFPDADSNTVQPSTAPSGQFATAISAAGVISYAAVTAANITSTKDLTVGNSIQVTAGTGVGATLVDVTIDTIQDIRTTASPSFASLALTNNTNQLVLGTTNTYTITMAALTASRTLTLPDANSVTVISSTAPANQFATGITTGGVITYAQPTAANLTGTKDLTVGPSIQVTAGSGTGATLVDVTVDTIQDIRVTATPTFYVMYLTNNIKQITLGSGPFTQVTMAPLTSDRIVTFPDADSNTVQPSTAPSSSFATGIDADGVISYAQPQASDIGGANDLTVGTSLLITAGTGIGATLVDVTVNTIQDIRTTATPQFSALGLGGVAGAANTLKLYGSTSGAVTVTTAAVAGTWTLTVPTSGGTSGYFLQTNGAGVTTWAPVTTSVGGTITSWVDVTTSTQSMLTKTGYKVDNGASLVSLTLPTTAVLGDVIEVAGYSSGLYTIKQSAGQIIHFGDHDTTSGATGSLAATNRYDAISLRCIVDNLEWIVLGSQGNFTVI